MTYDFEAIARNTIKAIDGAYADAHVDTLDGDRHYTLAEPVIAEALRRAYATALARAAEIARTEFADRRLWDETCRVVANEIAAVIGAEARKA